MKTDEEMVGEYSFPEAKGVVVSGDIHGEFNQLVDKCCVHYGITDSVIIVAGDCGFGFAKPNYYEGVYQRNKARLAKSNNYLLMVRGNHDNPAYFSQKAVQHKRFMTLPDYSIVKACGHTVLCIGGGISIDRVDRMNSRYFNPAPEGPFDKNVYWQDEPVVYDERLLSEVAEKYRVDTVISHTAPSFCEPTTKEGIEYYAAMDPKLFEDIDKERQTMDDIHSCLKASGHPLSNWLYGHFHRTWHSRIDGCAYSLLDVMELREV